MASFQVFKILTSLLFLALILSAFGAPRLPYKEKAKETKKVPVKGYEESKEHEKIDQYASSTPPEGVELSGEHIKSEDEEAKTRDYMETKSSDNPYYDKEDEDKPGKFETYIMKPDKDETLNPGKEFGLYTDEGTGSSPDNGTRFDKAEETGTVSNIDSGSEIENTTGSTLDKEAGFVHDESTVPSTESNLFIDSNENLWTIRMDESMDKEEQIYSYMEVVSGFYETLKDLLASIKEREKPTEKYDCSLQKTKDSGYRGALGEEDDFTIPPRCGTRQKHFTYGKRSIRKRVKRVIGGVESRLGEWPWLVSISKDGHHFCGGALISNTWILTAAHCFPDLVNPCDYRIRLGEHDLNSDKENHLEVTPLKIITHPQFDGHWLSNNDISVIKLREPVPFKSNINSICLPSLYDKFDITDKCTVAGWGFQDDWSLPMHIRHVSVSVMSDRVCKKLYPFQFKAGMMCAGHIFGGRDSCKGDSGGPLVCEREGVFVMAGIVSAGDGCAKAFRPGLYTRTTDFMDWIESAIFRNP